MVDVKENTRPRKKKEVKIVDISSDQIVQHIVADKNVVNTTPKSRRKSKANEIGQRLTYTPTFSKTGAALLDSDSEEDDDEDDFEMPAQHGTDSREPEEEGMLAGKNVFQFKSKKKSGQMALKALDSFSPNTAGRSPSGRKLPHGLSPLAGGKKGSPTTPAGVRTPSKSQRQLARKSLDPGVLTPQKSLGSAAIREHNRMESSTPYRLRKRQVEEAQDSSSDDSVDESSEEEEDDNENNSGELNGAPTPPRRSNKKDDLNVAASAEAYFDLHASTPVTSDRTLASLEGPRLDVDTVRSALAKLTPSHPRHCRALMDKYMGLFDRWMLHMCQGFNILLHGLGSKRSLMEMFREKQLSKFHHLVVNGYFPSLTVKHILNSITEDILDCPKGFTNPQAQVDYIKEEFRTKDLDFYLVLHNIDGVLLRSEKCQAVLSLLAEIEGFHIIASLDHINAGFMWDQTKYFRFRWLWYETPTFAPYEAENCYENSLLVQQSGGLALSSLAHVMRSLTPNAQQIFLVLAEYQMENGDSANYAGMSFQVLYHRCREAFLVNSDLTLQAQLVEFKDHRLLKAKKNFEGIEHLTIPINQATLKEFLQEHKNR